MKFREILVNFDGFWGPDRGTTVLGGLCSGLHGKSQKARPNDRILRGPPPGGVGAHFLGFLGFWDPFFEKFLKILTKFVKTLRKFRQEMGRMVMFIVNYY